MKKILIAFDGKHFSEGAFECIKSLNAIDPILAVGVFLPIVDYSELLYSLGGMAGPLYILDYEDEDLTAVEKNMEHFKKLCEKNTIKYKLHSDNSTHVISRLSLESRFADLLVIASEQFYENLGENDQENYIENTIHKSECPLLLIPEKYNEPQNIILAYDGSPSSIYAIKQFSYLFPQLRNTTTILVYINPGHEDVPDYEDIQEFAGLHFSNLTITKLKLKRGKEFDEWLMSNKPSLLVTGAYNRSRFSEMLRKSFIKDVIREHKTAIFIAHK